MIESTRECRAAVAATAIAVGAMFTTNVGAEPSSDAPSWSERIEWTTDGPAAREHQSLMTFGDQVVIFGGSGYEPQGAPLGDAWAFDLTSKTWTALELAGDVPDPAGSRRVAQSPGADHDVARARVARRDRRELALAVERRLARDVEPQVWRAAVEMGDEGRQPPRAAKSLQPREICYSWYIAMVHTIQEFWPNTRLK